jgi:hypothetical protein
MPQLVVHVKKDGSERPEPAYAVWVSDTDASVRAFGPEWEPTAARVERHLKSWLPTRGHRVLVPEAMQAGQEGAVTGSCRRGPAVPWTGRAGDDGFCMPSVLQDLAPSVSSPKLDLEDSLATIHGTEGEVSGDT